jgi:glycosyltransferase involved in cell wall biosynthesis
VLAQTLENVEIVAVDDGSRDGSDLILKRYAEAHPRLTIVRHSHNEGLHCARLSGVRAAGGRFIGYVDSDDYVAPDMFEHLYTAATNDRADIAVMGAVLIRDEDHGRPSAESSPDLLSFPDKLYPTGLSYLDGSFYPSMCLQIHRRALWDMVLPHLPWTRLIGEDNLTSFALALFAGPVVSLPLRGYYYVCRQHSLSTNGSLQSVAQHIIDRARVLRILRGIMVSCERIATSAWVRVQSDNRQLIFAYIGDLGNQADRCAAVALYEQHWQEPVPVHLRSLWGAD